VLLLPVGVLAVAGSAAVELLEEPPHAARDGTSTRAAAVAAIRVSTASMLGGRW